MTESIAVIEIDAVLSHLIPQNGFLGETELVSRRPRQRDFSQKTGEYFVNTPLSLKLRSDEVSLELRGVAHCIERRGEDYILEEEILLDRKSDFHGTVRDRALLRGQILALALCRAKNRSRITLRLCIFAEGEEEYQEWNFEAETLSQILSVHAPNLVLLAPLWQKEPSAVEFPYKNLRQGQKKLIRAVWDAVKNQNKLYACAPTGIGKTLAVLYPALKALETGKASQVFYASPKNTLKTQAAQAVATLQTTRSFHTLVLSAKMHLCPLKLEECQRSRCEYAEDFYQKLPEALSFLCGFDPVTEKELSEAAEKFCICPFELALKFRPYCQVVIGDYNHLFDPETALFPPEKSSILLVDEAHNLPARIRERYTETLCGEDLAFFFKDDSHPSRMLREHLAPLSTALTRAESHRAAIKRYHEFTLPEEVSAAVGELLPKLTFALRDGFGVPEEICRDEIRTLYQKCKRFHRLSKEYGESFATVYPSEGGVRIHLVDPREKIRLACEKWRSVIFFSATLSPQEYFFRLLAGEEGDEFLDLPSPFPRDNLFVGLVGVDVSYSQRFATAPKICSIIRSAISSRPGNYMVFLPSFEYLRLVAQEFKQQNFNATILVQKKTMSRQERNSFLEAFRTQRTGTLLGFCVMGGIFSEGVDLKGEALSGEIIVGCGFPPPSPEGEAECEAYYKKEMDGKNFAYTLPGWNRVLQAAGRVIRSEEDRGFLILCDLRYCQEDAKELFPDAWSDAVEIRRESQLREELNRFWN